MKSTDFKSAWLFQEMGSIKAVKKNFTYEYEI